MKRKDNPTDHSSASKKTKFNENVTSSSIGECLCCTNPSTIKLNCEHTFCTECLIKSFQNAIEENKFSDRVCCHVIPDNLIKAHLPQENFTRYTEARKMSKSLLRSCQQCQKDLYISDVHIENGKINCGCGFILCVRCCKQEHEGDCILSDEEYTLLNMAKKKGWHNCPRCGFIVEKIRGCCYMKCSCNAEFCNRCGRSWKKAEGELASCHHRCYYCSMEIIKYEFTIHKGKREYSYYVRGIQKAVSCIKNHQMREFIKRAQQWVDNWEEPKKSKSSKSVPISGLSMKKDELKIVKGSKKINSATIEKVKEELNAVLKDHEIDE